MRVRIFFLLFCTFLAGLPAWADPKCEALNHLNLPGIAIKSAMPVAAGLFSLPNRPGSPQVSVPAFCRVVGTVLPELNFELWMPAQWNHKYVAVGNGGLAGNLSYNGMVNPLERGYAAASTDTGHIGDGRDGSWALGHLGRVLNFGQNGVHLMAVANKAILHAYYGSAPVHSFFNGCSYGGKQALTEVQRYPKDFDGVIAGDPANWWTRHYSASHIWIAQAMEGDGYIPPTKVPILADAVNKACDALDGIKDGVLTDPRRCHFDPASIQCRSGDGAFCLTAAQVQTVRKIWSGPHDALGQTLYPGLEPGGEAGPGGWAEWVTGKAPGQGGHSALGLPVMRYMVFENPEWDLRSFHYESASGLENDLEFTQDKLSSIFDAVSPDLRSFRANGGKLIQYHGWSDPDIPPMNSINYYESVVRGESRSAGHESLHDTREFYRLFMVPGMQHCAGGPGPSRFDMLGALDQWVEQGKAPDHIVAAHATNGVVDRTRPLCAYPEEAHYKGSGSTDDAVNFVCMVPGN